MPVRVELEDFRPRPAADAQEIEQMGARLVGNYRHLPSHST